MKRPHSAVLILSVMLLLPACTPKNVKADTPTAPATKPLSTLLTMMPTIQPTGIITTSQPTMTTGSTAIPTLDALHKQMAEVLEVSSDVMLELIDRGYPFPKTIGEYGHSTVLESKYITKGLTELLAYVEPDGAASVKLDDVIKEKASDPPGFVIKNQSEGYKSYALAKDAKIFTIYEGTDIRYEIPANMLQKQIDYKNYNLYLVYLKGDQVQCMFECIAS